MLLTIIFWNIFSEIKKSVNTFWISDKFFLKIKIIVISKIHILKTTLFNFLKLKKCLVEEFK